MLTSSFRLLSLIGLLALSSSAIAALPPVSTPSNNSSATVVAPQSTSLTMYSNPSASSPVVETLKTPVLLVPIIIQGNWVKMGNTQNGNVGWINKNDLNPWLTANANELKAQFLHALSAPNNAEIYKAVEALTGGQITQQQAETIVKQWQSPQGQMFQQAAFQILQQRFQTQSAS